MIVSREGVAVDPPCEGEESAVLHFKEALAGRRETFVWDPERAGLDVAVGNETALGPNRARLKAFSPRPGTVVILAYKDSQTPFSNDRFSYGALIFRRNEWDPQAIDDLLDYACGGLLPAQRPKSLKRAFPFTVPR